MVYVFYYIILLNNNFTVIQKTISINELLSNNFNLKYILLIKKYC